MRLVQTIKEYVRQWTKTYVVFLPPSSLYDVDLGEAEDMLKFHPDARLLVEVPFRRVRVIKPQETIEIEVQG